MPMFVDAKTYALLIVLITGWGGLVFAQNVPMAARQIGVDIQHATIPIDDILSGGPPPQGIPALGFDGDWQGAAHPSPTGTYISQEEASAWLQGREPVIVVHINGEAKAYPLQILTWHEIANDVVGGVPVAVSFCPLCNSALAFDRRIPLTAQQAETALAVNKDITFQELDPAFLEAYYEQEALELPSDTPLTGLEVTFGVSGMLYNSNMLMFDTKTSTLWSQLLGLGTVGTLTDTQLLRYSAQIVSFDELQQAFPEALVLSRDTGMQRDYGRNPYVGYDDIDSPAFLFHGITDNRLPPKARVISLEKGPEAVVYPFTSLQESQVINDTFADAPLALFWSSGTASALSSRQISEGVDVGAVGVFSSIVPETEQELTFTSTNGQIYDTQTNSRWNLLGQALSGPLAGTQLTAIPHDNTLWFAWAAFKPETRIYGAE